MVIFTVLLFAAVYYLCRALGFGAPLSFTAVGLMALTLCSSPKLREIYYEHVLYYSISIAVICVMLALYVQYTETFRNKHILLKIALLLPVFAVAFGTALDGTQVVACSVLPVIFAAGCDVIFSKEKLLSKNRIPFIVYCAVAGAATLIGLAVFKKGTENIGIGYANAYSSYSMPEEWVGNLLKLPVQWFELFGIEVEPGMSLFSPESIVNILRIAVALVLGLAPVAALIFIGRFDRRSKLLIYAHYGMTGVIMVGYIFGILSLASWRLSPIICTGVIVCVVAAREAKKYITLKRVAVIGCAVLAVFSLVSVSVITAMPKNGLEENRYYHVAEFLDENGLNYGYATFWNSQCISVLSDFEVRAANTDINEHGITPCRYQSNKNWFEPVEGVDRYFLLLSDREIETLRSTEDWHYIQEDPVETLEYDGFTIFIFENTDFLH
jgi:hypothetical protein